MKNLFLASLALVALNAGSSAFAADMPVKGPVYRPPPPIFTWDGCYIGLHVGGGWQRSSFVDQGRGGVMVAPLQVVQAESGVGWLGGGQAGCNVQWRQFVIGLEGEYWGSTLYDREFQQFDRFTFDAKSRNRWDGAISVRSGVTFDRAFIYGKLGAVWGKFNYTSDLASGPFFTETVRGDATITGVLIGVGFEYALTDNWTTKFEYNYIDYGNKIVNFTDTRCNALGPVCETETFSQTVKERKQIAKIGINYKFDWGKGPVAVRAAY
jgi:outer membrane immunogenic protein